MILLPHRTALCALVLLATAAVAFGGDDPPRPGGRDKERREEWQKLTPEEREARMKERRERGREEWRKRQEQFRNMTAEEREAKRKEFMARLEQRLGELRQKQTNGTISAGETDELRRREHILKRFKQAETTPDKQPGGRSPKRQEPPRQTPPPE